jgi:hypothetical protein
MAKAPDLVPAAVGAKVTLMVQALPISTGLPQVLACAKSPLAVMLAISSV